MSLHLSLSSVASVLFVGAFACVACGVDDQASDPEPASDESEVVARPGKVGDSCGARGARTCATNLKCVYSQEAACGAADMPGKCIEVRADAACAANYDPVCGCDGKTYSNACRASTVGASIAKKGQCATPLAKAGESCGARGGVTCEAGLHCIYDKAAKCGAADQPGSCVDVTVLACAEIYKPVCGCDGKTYGNECDATASGASVAKDGACGN